VADVMIYFDIFNSYILFRPLTIDNLSRYSSFLYFEVLFEDKIMRNFRMTNTLNVMKDLTISISINLKSE